MVPRTSIVFIMLNYYSDFSVQDAPPIFDREGGVHKYSRAFKDMVESCLVKDPAKRFLHIGLWNPYSFLQLFYFIQASGGAAFADTFLQECQKKIVSRGHHTTYVLSCRQLEYRYHTYTDPRPGSCPGSHRRSSSALTAP